MPHDLISESFELFPYGILVVDPQGRVIHSNAKAAQMLGEFALGDRCCDLLGCASEGNPLAGRCFSAMSREQGTLPEVRVDLEAGRPEEAVWVTAAPLTGKRTVIELRPGTAGDRRRRTTPHWVTGPMLWVYSLGRTRIESAEGELSGHWLDQRAGQLLKLLISERDRYVPTDEIAEALRSRPDVTSSANVRYCVHTLRDHLEPGRAKKGDSSFIVYAHGGYAIDRRNVWIDADEFEDAVGSAIGQLWRGATAEAEPLLDRATELYQGDFLEDEPYAEWALPERDRLRALASDAFDARISMLLVDADLDAAFPLMDRLAELQPYDMAVQRRRIALTLARGHRSDAVRQYETLRRRMHDVFNELPPFRLADIKGTEVLAQADFPDRSHHPRE